MEWSDEVDAAGWIVERLHPFARDVGSVIPEGFEAYARVFHPAYAGRTPVRWAEIASQAGRIVHPEMQFDRIVGDVEVDEPRMGTLDPFEAAALCGLLTGFTSTPDRCWFCLWEGWGWPQGGTAFAAFTRDGGAPLPPGVPPAVFAGPRVRVPGREFLLYRGPVTDALAFVEEYGQTPQLWWPEERAWCVSTEIDFMWSYIGGTLELIDALIADARFEALWATITDRFTKGSDLLNR